MKLSRSRGRLRVQHKQEDFSPMEGVGNMADAMLVFACGLIVALILSWNVDVTEQGIQKDPEVKYEVQGMEDGASDEVEADKALEELGTVYKDPATGKYYVIEEDENESESNE